MGFRCCGHSGTCFYFGGNEEGEKEKSEIIRFYLSFFEFFVFIDICPHEILNFALANKLNEFFNDWHISVAKTTCRDRWNS